MERRWVHSGLCMGALLGVLGSAGAAKPFRGHDGRLGPARVRRQGRKRRHWRGPQAQPRTRVPQRPLTGGAPAEARQAAHGGAQVARSGTGGNTFALRSNVAPGRAMTGRLRNALRAGREPGCSTKWPIRRSRFGGNRRGAKRSAAEMGTADPLEASAARNAAGANA